MLIFSHPSHPLQVPPMACHPGFSPRSGNHVLFLTYPNFAAEHCHSSSSSILKEEVEGKKASPDDKEKSTEHLEAKNPNARKEEPQQQPPMLDSTSDDVVVQKPIIRQDESSTGITMTLDVAGYSIDDLEIELDNGILTIAGRRRNRIGTTFVFRRRLGLKLDRLKRETLAANLTEGVLEITVQKKDIALPRSRVIPILTTTTTSNDATLEPILQKGDQDIEISPVAAVGDDETNEGKTTTTTTSNTEDSDHRLTATPVETVTNDYDEGNEGVEEQEYVANTIQDDVEVAKEV